MSKKKIVVIPTLNENENIVFLFKIIVKRFKLPILFIDDNSDDGTRDIILKLAKKNKLVNYIFRKQKYGIGSAHKEGLNWAIKKKFKICITMDADRTHDPLEIKKILKNFKQKKVDLITTTRFMKKNSLSDWPLLRRYLTKLRFFLVKFILNTKFDSSGSFRCYNLHRIKKSHLDLARNDGYFFFIESLFYLEKLNYKVVEIPTNYRYRYAGKSKMQLYDIISAFYNLFKLSFINKL